MATQPSPDLPDDAHPAPRRRGPFLARTEGIPPVGGPVRSDRPFVCPECRLAFPIRDKAHHLAAAHGYVDVAGALLPLTAALASLWDRVFRRGDAAANQRLCEILATVPPSSSDAPAYSTALEAELCRRADALFASRWQELPRLVRCLRQHEAARPHFWRLVHSTDPRVRETGRELLLPEATAQLAGAGAAEVRAWLERLCPLEDPWEKIRLCQRLARFGVPEPVLKECLRQLRGERPVACPTCGVAVPQGELEQHLRQAHHVYRYRGEERSLDETLAVLMGELCSPKPDPDAWDLLEQLAREEHGARAMTFLAVRLSQLLSARTRQGDAHAIPSTASFLAGVESAPNLVAALAGLTRGTAHHLALALAARLPGPVDTQLVTALQPHLADKRVPSAMRQAAAAALLRSTGLDGPAALQVVQALVARSGKVRAVERLRQLEKQVGKSPAIDAVCAGLEEKIRMRCPRCGLQLRRPQMVQHVWTAHGMLLHGRRVREPWQLIDNLLEEYRTAGDEELLDRCRSLAQFLDAQGGSGHLNRLLLAKGIADEEARVALLGQARSRDATLCPHCYALIPVVEEDTPQRPLEQSHGRLWADGYAVEVSETGLVPFLQVHSPGSAVHHGREPGRWCTGRASLFLLVGPPVLVALLAAIVLPVLGIPAFVWVFRLVGMALLARIGVGLWWRWQPLRLDRTVDYAWTLLVPNLHATGFSRSDSAFVARLALSSIGRGRADVRDTVLVHALMIAERAVTAGAAPLSHLAALRRLAIEDAARSGRDAVRLAVAQVRRCFEAELPLVYAETLLAEWESDCWTSRNLTRLRVLLSDAAFEAGLELGDLGELCRTAPALGDVLRPDRNDELALLRLLWSLRPRRPWGRWSAAATVFEVAADEPEGALLASYPDLLLADRDLPAVYLGAGGVSFEGRLFAEAPRHVEVKARRGFEGVEYEMVLDDLRLRFATDPRPLVERLERWFRYWFDDFLPQVASVASWQAPGQAQRIRLRAAVRCPDCQRPLMPRKGDVGERCEEDAGGGLGTK